MLGCGALYGNGEADDTFFDFFRKAWLSLHPKLSKLPILGRGDNIIPTLHVVDLARTVKLLLNAKPK